MRRLPPFLASSILLAVAVQPAAATSIGSVVNASDDLYTNNEITIAGNLKDMFQNIEMVGNDLEMRGRITSPTIKISRMTVAGD